MGPITRRLAGLENRKGWTAVLLAVLAFALVVPVLNMALEPGHPLHVPTYVVQLLGKYLCYAMLALALDLVWGFAGALSLGHGAFFALGGYVMGMYLMRQIGDRSVYGNAELPDFMVFLNWDSLPWYWMGFDSFAFTTLMVLAVPGVLAFVFGWLAFRSRITGVYFSIITQAMTYALMLAFFRNEMGFGGNNGLTDFKDILGFSMSLDSTKVGLYVATVLMLAVAYLACRFIVTSRLGRVLLAVRDAESRVRFLGHSVTGAKLFAFVVSAMIAGVAGALYVPQVGIINPSEFSPANSIEIAIWTAVGGRGTLFGPILGAMSVNAAKSFFTGVAPEVWLFFLGSLFVVVTLFLPRGLVGLFGLLKRRQARALPEVSPAPARKATEETHA
ncbi:urea ABC transporter permease subunit UrtC [Caenispirillum salinarum]|uniref:urea ABC transporter permease subunit UrtC n=1 Tax=Caenispirillum salinarum TaxID=859058 RepID=UPI00384E5C0D